MSSHGWNAAVCRSLGTCSSLREQLKLPRSNAGAFSGDNMAEEITREYRYGQCQGCERYIPQQTDYYFGLSQLDWPQRRWDERWLCPKCRWPATQKASTKQFHHELEMDHMRRSNEEFEKQQKEREKRRLKKPVSALKRSENVSAKKNTNGVKSKGSSNSKKENLTKYTSNVSNIMNNIKKKKRKRRNTKHASLRGEFHLPPF